MRDITRMKIMLKGIVTAEDADLAAQNGIDGIPSPIMAGAARTTAAPPSTRCRRSSPR
jgi:isopentenyl diphosphate isomerase/L-lactate dehydrogenase-like FMN-dependent dehydrogenase